MENSKCQAYSFYVNFTNSNSFYLNVADANPKKIKIASVLLHGLNAGDIYCIKLPFLNFNFYSAGTNDYTDTIDLETWIYSPISWGWYNITCYNITNNVAATQGYGVINMIFYYN